MRRKRYCIRMAAALFIMAAALLAALGTHAAADTAINTDNDRFQELSGDAAYLNCVDNYYIDVEDLGIMDYKENVESMLCNVFFFIIKKLCHITVMLFYYCMDFDMAELLRDQISGIQDALKGGLFEPLFILAFCGAAVHMIKRLIQRDMMGAYGQVLKVITILALSVLIVQDSATALSAATEITKSASAQILSGMQDGEAMGLESYAAEAAGTLWVSMVHQPWVYVEFMPDEPDAEEIKNFLSNEYPAGSPARETLVKEHEGRAFLKDGILNKLNFLILLLIPTVVKCVIYIVMGVLMMVYQLLAVFYVLLAPVILLLVMIPGYESLMGAWLKKLLETQLGVLIISFIMGLLIKVDNLLFSNLSDTWGCLVVLVVQVVLEIFVIMKRQELLGLIGKLQRTVSNPGYARAMLQHGNANGAKMGLNTIKAVRNLPVNAVKMGHAIGNTVQKVSETAGAAAEMAGAAAGTVAGGAERLYRKAAAPEVMASAAQYAASEEYKLKRPVLSDFNKEQPREENIIRVAPRGRGEQRHLERIGGAKNTSVSPPRPQGEPVRPSMREWRGETVKSREERPDAHMDRQGSMQHGRTGQPGISVSGIPYQAARQVGSGNAAVSPSEPQGEPVRPTMNIRGNEPQAREKASGQTGKNVQKPAPKPAQKPAQSAAAPHPKISARDRQKENLAARQKIPAKRPRYAENNAGKQIKQ